MYANQYIHLNGEHVLVLGNHDEAIKKHKDELLAMKKQDGNALFEEICEYKEITVQQGQDKFRLVLFHYPLSEWNAGHHGSIHLYGHIHANIANIKGKALNVGYDLHGKILSFEEIYDFVKDLPPFEYSKHRMFSEEDSVESRSARIKEVLEKLNFDPSWSNLRFKFTKRIWAANLKFEPTFGCLYKNIANKNTPKIMR